MTASDPASASTTSPSTSALTAGPDDAAGGDAQLLDRARDVRHPEVADLLRGVLAQ